MKKALVEFLKDKRDELVQTHRVNVVTKEVGYSEYTRWNTTVSYDEIEVLDFDKLLAAIDEFESTFN